MNNTEPVAKISPRYIPRLARIADTDDPLLRHRAGIQIGPMPDGTEGVRMMACNRACWAVVCDRFGSASSDFVLNPKLFRYAADADSDELIDVPPPSCIANQPIMPWEPPGAADAKQPVSEIQFDPELLEQVTLFGIAGEPIQLSFTGANSVVRITFPYQPHVTAWLMPMRPGGAE